jgi:hypothetical protein
VLGATVVARRLRVDLAAGAPVAIVAQGVGVGLPAVWVAIGLAFAAFHAGGIAHGTKDVLVRTLIHEQVSEGLHGRTYAAYTGLRNAAELVALALDGCSWRRWAPAPPFSREGRAGRGRHRLRRDLCASTDRGRRSGHRPRASSVAIRLTTSAAGSTEVTRPTPWPA